MPAHRVREGKTRGQTSQMLCVFARRRAADSCIRIIMIMPKNSAAVLHLKKNVCLKLQYILENTELLLR